MVGRPCIGFIIDTRLVNISYRIFNDYFDLPIHQEGEVIVHYNDSVRAVEAIRDLVIEHKLPVNYITEVCNQCLYTDTSNVFFLCMSVSN